MRLAAAILSTLLLVNISYAQSLPGDTDGDGLRDREENRNGNGRVDPGETNPLDADTDGGGEADGSEVKRGANPLVIWDDLVL